VKMKSWRLPLGSWKRKMHVSESQQATLETKEAKNEA
jgi:hypothetical protein